ncbi:MAG: type II toxin-antitoxin system RelE/ParE family toxin [Anaerolineales bacterium]|nr:type II toxin-antitoxin system RelE/ParE family toxin [Anaerolineales bacterium]
MTTPAARKSIRKLPKHIQSYLKQELFALSEHPDKGKRLHGEFKYLHSLRMVFRGTHYRAAYEVDYEAQEITIHFVGTRENYYVDLKRKLPQPSKASNQL